MRILLILVRSIAWLLIVPGLVLAILGFRLCDLAERLEEL